jgi:hypothetical protein
MRPVTMNAEYVKRQLAMKAPQSRQKSYVPMVSDAHPIPNSCSQIRSYTYIPRTTPSLCSQTILRSCNITSDDRINLSSSACRVSFVR